MRSVRHPNILRLIEVLHVKSKEEAFLVLEHAQKGSLGAYLERGHRIPDAAIFSILKQVTGALKYLHSAGYIHQDIKPSNILIDADGRAMLADFGVGHSFASAGMVVGSPAYQAPEALDDSYGSDEEPDALDEPQKEDVWALGVTLYQLLFRALPFLGSTLFEIVNNVRQNPLKIPEGTDPDVAGLLRGMLIVDPMSRLGIDDLLTNPLIHGAADRVRNLPEMPPSVVKEGPIVELQAEVCRDGYSFAEAGRGARRRSSYTGNHGEKAGERARGSEAASGRSSWGIACMPIWMGTTRHNICSI
jgi:serine/threonine-protein kinase 11